MKSLFSYLILMLVILFWILRIVVTLAATAGSSFILVPLNTTVEIVLLFVTLVCIALIIKRSMIGAIIYLISYGAYFGVDLYNNVTSADYTSLFVSAVAMILALAVFFDIAMSVNKSGGTRNKKSEWFYGNEEYDRKLDERADKNEYKGFR